MNKKPLSFWQMFNLNFGFLGIQFGWALQMANMSGIYKFLGADENQVAHLWIFAPLAGLILQPIFGQISDNTWTRLGRRRPFILAGTLIATISLVLMPNSINVIMAAALLFALDASLNLAMQPYRALVADVAPANQITLCFAIQTCLVGIGSTLASALPWLLIHVFHMEGEAILGSVPMTLKISFYLGAAVFILANIWTIFSSTEYPPENLKILFKNINLHTNPRNKLAAAQILTEVATRPEEATIADSEHITEKQNFLTSLKNIFAAIGAMPKVMQEISYVQVFSWVGMFCLYLFFGLGVAQNIYNLPPGVDVNTNSTLHNMLEQGIALGGLCFAAYTFFSVFFSALIPFFSRFITRKGTHALFLALGALGLISSTFIHEHSSYLFISMLGMGAAWASIITIPYAMLGNALPKDKIGLYMGLFNATICIPEIIASLTLGFIIQHFFHDHAMSIIFMGGICFLIAAGLTFLVHDKE